LSNERVKTLIEKNIWDFLQ